ncbi:MAG: hypothetical protein CUN55_19985, partial [Phototrophicales bacterium]
MYEIAPVEQSDVIGVDSNVGNNQESAIEAARTRFNKDAVHIAGRNSQSEWASESDLLEITTVANANAKFHDFEYLNLVKDVLNNGEFRNDRTGTGTYSVFGRQMRFD